MNRVSDYPISKTDLESEISQQLDEIVETGNKFREQILKLGQKLKSFQEAEGQKMQELQNQSNNTRTIPNWMKPIETKLVEMTNAKRKISDDMQKLKKRRFHLQKLTAGKFEDVLKDVATLKSLTDTTMELKPKLDEGEKITRDLKSQIEKIKRELKEKVDLFDSSIKDNQGAVNSSLEKFGLLSPEVDADGWIMIQQRLSGPREDFERGWTEYENGFGSVYGNFWLGLKKLHELTADGSMELRIELTDWDGNSVHANYSKFSVGNDAELYRLSVGEYSGNAGDSLQFHDGGQFSTMDKKFGSNAERLKGGWWKSFDHVNLNGLYYEKKETRAKGDKGYDGVYWWNWKNGYSLQKVLMKIRQRK